MTPKLFSELGLSAEVLKAIDKLGFEQAAPIQAEAIPVLMSGRDAVGQSQTGSGKTAAFAIPAIEKTDPQERATQVLILCPTRELAVQVSEEVHKLAFFKRGIHVLPIYGGQSYDRQLYGLKQGAHIVIGTPGRLMDHMRRGTLKLDALKLVVLDEVDVMLNMGFRDDIELILQATPASRQTVFFSATIPRPIQDLIRKYARDPQNVRIEQKALTVPTVEQTYYEVDRRYKIQLLTRLIDIHDLKLGIIFCNTKRMVDDLVDHLNAQGYSADRLHGDMSQTLRDRVMNKFRKSGLEFLVATDVAARGIDVDDIQVVFNYDLPYDGEDYVHRIGRTGRAGRSGRAISFASGRELFQIRNIERYTNTRIHRGRPPTVQEVEEARENVFVGKLRSTLQSGAFKPQDHLVERLLEEGFTSTDIVSALLHHLQGGGDSAPPAKPARADWSETQPPSPAFAPTPAPRREPAHREPTLTRPRPLRQAQGGPLPSVPLRSEPVSAEVIGEGVEAAENLPRDSREGGDAAPVQGFKARKIIPRTSENRGAHSTASGQVPWRAHRDDTARPQRIPSRNPGPPPSLSRGPRPSVQKPKPAVASGDYARLHINLGAEMGIESGDVVGAILGETGLPAKTVGPVDIRERHIFVDVISEHVHSILAKLNRTRIKGHKFKAKVA